MFIGFITKNKKDPLYSSNYYYMNILDIETMMIGSIPFILIILFNLSLIYSIIVLLYPILYPTIITYPWTSLLEDDNENDKTTKQKKRNNDPWLLLTSFFSLFNHNHNNKNQTVVLAGSFNPPHLGHLAVLLYLSSRYGQVIVVIGMNPNKQYLVSPTERADLVRNMLQNTSAAKNVRIEVISGYIWRKVKPMGGQIFIRGIRSWEKDGIDERKLQIQNTWGPLVLGPLWWPLRTIFIEGKPQYIHISSTIIRNIINQQTTIRTTTFDNSESSIHKELSNLVPECLVNDIIKLYSYDICL